MKKWRVVVSFGSISASTIVEAKCITAAFSSGKDIGKKLFSTNFSMAIDEIPAELPVRWFQFWK